MLLEFFELDWEMPAVQLALGLLLGGFFGVAAQISRFCIRRGLVGDVAERRPALGVWLTALFMAVLSCQVLNALGYIDLSDHRLLSSDIPVLAILVGGLAFGAGMVLTRGCASRLTVLVGSGNLRALFVLVVFAVVAHATLKGAFAGLRTSLGSVTVEAPFGSLSGLLGNAWLATALALVVIGAAIWHLRPSIGSAALAGVIGVLAAVGWAATSVLLVDEFDPAPVQSLAFTLPWTESLFWTIASSAIPYGFGTGLIAGVMGGALLSSLARGEFVLQSFESPTQTLRYISGGVLMGFGGVLAGGCTVGAGLSGTAMLSVSAILALGAIVVGAKLMHAALGWPQRTALAAA